MAYKIGPDCASCGACAGSCPNDAISEGNDRYVIDESKCTDCGTCAEICPVAAITK